MKTVRFSLVVKKSGQPEPHTLWTKPESDRELQQALKSNRVMTVHQSSVGTRKDYGTVGFAKSSGGGEILIFPKSLKTFEGKRVVGVKYDLLQEPPEIPAS